jgi:hypothetical protein
MYRGRPGYHFDIVSGYGVAAIGAFEFLHGNASG